MTGRVSSATAVACLTGLLLSCSPDRTEVASTDNTPTPTKRGFVLTDFSFEQPESPQDACPQGFNQDEREFYLAGLTPDERAAENLPEGLAYLRLAYARGETSQCDEPTAFEDPGHLTLDGPGVAAGFDLDGVTSTRENPGPAACPHEDFSSASGEPGIDNALWRVLGCIDGYQRGSTIDEYAIENIKAGGRTILIEITDLDDPQNDNDVGLGIYSSPDTLPTSAAGSPLPGGSLSVMEGPRYRNVARGALVDGVLTAGPIDLRLEFDGQFLDSELHLQEAQIRLELTPDGGLRGLLGGYWDIEGYFESYARQATRAGAFTVGFRCTAIYEALARLADRYPDPETGACRAVSTAFRIQAIPAFVVEPPSSSTAQMSKEPSSEAL